MKKVIVRRKIKERTYEKPEMEKIMTMPDGPEKTAAIAQMNRDIETDSKAQAKSLSQRAIPLSPEMEKRVVDIVRQILKSPSFTKYVSSLTTKKADGIFKSLTKKMKKPEVDVDAATAVMEEEDIIESFSKQMNEQQTIEEEISIFLKENNLKEMTHEEALVLVKEGLLQNIASKLKMKPAQAALAIGLFLNSGAVRADTGNPQVDNIIQQIEKFSNLDLNKDGKIGSGAASPEKSKEAENIRTFKSTAEAEKATGHKTTEAYKTLSAAASATSDMQNYDGATYRGVVKVGKLYHGLYTPFGTR